MRRLALIIVIVAVHGLAILCAAGGINPRDGILARIQESPEPPTSSPSDASPPPSSNEQSSPPTASDRESTYEQFMRERENAAAASMTPESTALPSGVPFNPFHVEITLDLTNAYFFRGLLQQDRGLIVQPAATLTINLFERDGWTIDGVLGTWNSFGSNGGTNTGELTSDWYECDLIAGFTIAKDEFSLATTYTFFTSPSDAYQTVQEVDLTFAYDDSELLGAFALNPYATLSIETSSIGSDGADPGIYLELGVEPGFSFNLGKTPVAVTFPVAVGLSLYDYYQDAGGVGDDSTFGFVQGGVNLSMPLPFGERYGQWTLNAGASCLYLSNNLAKINGDDNLEVIGTLGLQWNF